MISPTRSTAIATARKPRRRTCSRTSALAPVVVISLAIAGVGCAAPRAPAPPARPTIVVIVSANVEWKVLSPKLPPGESGTTPFGEWRLRAFADRDVIFFHGGYGKVSAAGSTQYAIDRWHPLLIVNAGTCGGFGGARK